MAAGGTYSVVLSNGQTLSVYQAASLAVGASPPCTITGAAASTTTTTDFSVMSPCYITDVVVAATLTAGGWEVFNVSKGVRSGKGVWDLAPFLATNTTRNPPRILFAPGQVYRLLQTTAGNA